MPPPCDPHAHQPWAPCDPCLAGTPQGDGGNTKGSCGSTRGEDHADLACRVCGTRSWRRDICQHPTVMCDDTPKCEVWRRVWGSELRIEIGSCARGLCHRRASSCPQRTGESSRHATAVTRVVSCRRARVHATGWESLLWHRRGTLLASQLRAYVTPLRVTPTCISVTISSERSHFRSRFFVSHSPREVTRRPQDARASHRAQPTTQSDLIDCISTNMKQTSEDTVQ